MSLISDALKKVAEQRAARKQPSALPRMLGGQWPEQKKRLFILLGLTILLVGAVVGVLVYNLIRGNVGESGPSEVLTPAPKQVIFNKIPPPSKVAQSDKESASSSAKDVRDDQRSPEKPRVLQVAALPEVAPGEESHKDTGQKSDDHKVMQKDTAGAAEPVEPAVESRKQPRQPSSQVKVGMVGLESVNDGSDQPEAVEAEKAPRSRPTEADRKMTSQTATAAAAKRPEPTRITVGKSRRSNTRGKPGQVDLQAETTTSAAALYRKAVSYQKQMKWNTAIETYKQVIRLEPMSAEVYNNLGVCYEKQGDLKMAAMSYEKAITINPRFYPSYNNLGIIYYRLKNFEKARYAYEQALELNPGNSQSEVNLALVYERLNRDTLARRTLERVLVNDPSNAAAHYNLGRMLEDQGDPEAAITHYRQFLASSPSAYPQITEKVKDRVRSLQEISNN